MTHSYTARTSILMLCMCLLCVPTGMSLGQSTTSDVRELSQRQSRARALTESLITRSLDHQLQRMRDNGLTDLALYKDLTEMRGRVNNLARVYMARVQDLLAKAATAQNDSDRREFITSAQSEMQTILRRLVAERERVRVRRQRMALIERMREIIVSQGNAIKQTQQLGDSNEQGILITLNQQNTTATLFHAFASTLKSVSNWPGELGATAAEASEILTAAKLEVQLKTAAAELERTQIASSLTAQQKILSDLKLVEVKIRKLLDPAWIGSDLVKAVNEIIQEQEQLRKQTRAGAEANTFALLESQTLIQEKLLRLAEKLVVSNERAAMLASRASNSADEARQAVFRDEIADAVDRQGGVIGALVELRDELNHNDGRRSVVLSASQYRLLALALSRSKESILTVQTELRQAEDVGKLQQAMLKASERLKDLKFDKNVPPVVPRRVESVKGLLEGLAKADVAPASESFRNLDQRIGFAIGELSENITDSLRNAEAMKIAELNRAAESIARAMGATRSLGVGEVAVDAEAANERSQTLAQVAQIASKVAVGVHELAPEAIPPLERASRQSKLLEPRSVIASPDTLKALRTQTLELANELQTAGQKLRTEMTWTAALLEERVSEELEKVSSTASALDALAVQSPQPSEPALRTKGNALLNEHAAIGAALHMAADISSGNVPVEQRIVLIQRQLERVRVLADLKRLALEDLLAQVRELLEAAKRQEEAANELLVARDNIEAGNDEKVDANEVAEAFSDFANSLNDIGEAAKALTGQSQIANQPIAEAAEIASGLNPESADSAESDPQATDPQSTDSQPSDTPPSTPQDSEPSDTGLVPSDSVASTELLSGSELASIASEALASEPGTLPGTLPGVLPGVGPGVGPGIGTLPGPPIDGPPSEFGEGAMDDLLAQRANSSHDSSTGGSRRSTSSWTTTLPKSIRESIQSSGRRPLPKYYERRLKSYFEALIPKNPRE